MNTTLNILTVTLAGGLLAAPALAQNSAPEIKFDSVPNAIQLPNQVGELFFAREYARAGLASRLPQRVDGDDVVVVVDRARFLVTALFPTAYPNDYIHHSTRRNRQAQSPPCRNDD